MKLLRSNRVEHRRAADIRAEIGKVDKAALSAKVCEIEQERRLCLLKIRSDSIRDEAHPGWALQ
jgi:hypothetical protein